MHPDSPQPVSRRQAAPVLAGSLLAAALVGCAGRDPPLAVEGDYRIVSLSVVRCPDTGGCTDDLSSGLPGDDDFQYPPTAGQRGYELTTLGAKSSWSLLASAAGLAPSSTGIAYLHYRDVPGWVDRQGIRHADQREVDLLFPPCADYRASGHYALRQSAGADFLEDVFEEGGGGAPATTATADGSRLALCLRDS